MVQGLGAVHCTMTVVFPQGRVPGGREGSSAVQADNATRASIGPGVISTSPGRPIDCICRKLKTACWTARGFCLATAGAEAAAEMDGGRIRGRRMSRRGLQDNNPDSSRRWMAGIWALKKMLPVCDYRILVRMSAG